MDNVLEIVKEHNLVKNAQRKFNALFIELQEMKTENTSPEVEEFIFLLETQLISLYFQRIKQNLKIISSSHPDVLSFTNKKELSDLAIQRLLNVLDSYDPTHVTALLKCTMLPLIENI